MLTWLSENPGTIFVSIILIVLVALVIRTMIRDRKMGKSACGCSCASCKMSAACKQTGKE